MKKNSEMENIYPWRHVLTSTGKWGWIREGIINKNTSICPQSSDQPIIEWVKDLEIEYVKDLQQV